MRIGLPPCLTREFAITQILEALPARLDAKLKTVSHADHDLATYFGCDGDKSLSVAVF